MKTTFQVSFILMVLFCLTGSTASAKIWRVNDHVGHAGKVTGFTTAQAAHDAANAGDSIILEPSQNTYGDLTITKKLIIIGTGYFLNQNPKTKWNRFSPSTLTTVNFGTNSENSQMMGISCLGTLQIYTSNITIIKNLVFGNASISQLIDPISNVIIRGNYLCGSFYSDGQLQNIIIENNIIDYTAAYVAKTFNVVVEYNGIFKNNVLRCRQDNYYPDYLSVDNFLVQNNIICDGYFNPDHNKYSYNISDNKAFGDQNGNQQNIYSGSLFQGTGSPDGQYMLKVGSPAIGAGFEGVDCGVFGGPNPYVLSGIPPIPAIYDYLIGGNGSQENE